MTFDLVHPTPQQLRDGVTCGLIAESIMIPVLLTLTFVNHTSVHWGYMIGAVACILVSIGYQVTFSLVTDGQASVRSQANSWFVIACLALAGLACIELSTATPAALYTPAMLVGVIFVSIVGDRRMQVVIDLYALALIAVIGWVQGLRGGEFLVSMVVYASTIAVVNFICARTVGSLTGQINFSQALDALNECIDEVGTDGARPVTDTFAELFSRGIPYVARIVPAQRVAVFVRNGSRQRYTLLASWPDLTIGAGDLALLPAVATALADNTVQIDPWHCVLPVGYAQDGELVMVIERSVPDGTTETRTAEEVGLLAASFLRVTSRVNFVNGLHTESRTDPLTGLANRRSLMERIEMEMAHALRSESPLSVAMIDLDHFKEFNDRYGHIVGDTVLRSIAAMMVSNTRDQDLVARYGGEEFCLVLPDTDLLGGHHILDHLRNGGRDSTTALDVTMSVGLTSWDGIEDPVSFIDRADRALYQAKNSGRDRVVSIAAYTEQ
ncbi:MAG TPA: GGDEF domain-containing protein [Acidimicrobiales bacterium]|nr:GGDEF domain-containing protein [Acidimicrobiales bacterium]